MTMLDVGVFLPTMAEPGNPLGDVAAAAQHAERLGLESVWVVDQLIGGTGVPFLDSTIALTAAAAVTKRVRLGFGVVILPLHPVVWLAKQVASLQYLSSGRVLLGVGAGGDRHERSWLAAGVPRRERGRRTDAALRVLPSLIAGQPTALEDLPESPPVQLSPPAGVPPILVGGMSEAALRRAAKYADGWFALPAPPAMIAEVREHLARLAAERNRPIPDLTATVMTALEPDPALPDAEGLRRRLTDPDGMFGIPPDQADNVVWRGGPAELADVLTDYRQAGAKRVVISVAAGDWFRQTELLADAYRRLH
jgi:alkanesulfonate monooxygenase SsuD/methylene tetrahydromethanopterin reductase-like flavin-dependent oxidoreductase (luciferase family)